MKCTVVYELGASNVRELKDESVELLVRAISNHVTVRLRYSMLLLVLSVYADEDKQSMVGFLIGVKFVWAVEIYYI